MMPSVLIYYSAKRIFWTLPYYLCHILRQRESDNSKGYFGPYLTTYVISITIDFPDNSYLGNFSKENFLFSINIVH